MTTKTFDSVKLMRELRAEISQAMEHLTPQERIRYIQAKAAMPPNRPMHRPGLRPAADRQAVMRLKSMTEADTQ